MIVTKFGGTSVSNTRRIQYSSRIIRKFIDSGEKVVVVVSAMAGVTNQLLNEISQVTGTKNTDCHDFILSSGEQVSTGLLALALREQGINAVPLMGWQIPILTDKQFSGASVKQIPTNLLNAYLENDIVPVVTGFQGVTQDKKITTLGRGGSDLSAVELALALRAKHCYIFTDVEGVYSSDPYVIPEAFKIDELTYEEMYALSANGAKVLDMNAARITRDNKLSVSILSSFIDGIGTKIVSDVKEQSRIAGMCWKKPDEKTFNLTFVGKNIPNIDLISGLYCKEKSQHHQTFSLPIDQFSYSFLSKLHHQLFNTQNKYEKRNLGFS